MVLNLLHLNSAHLLGGVYKLAAVEENGTLSPRIKLSENEEKITNPGYKTVFRFKDKETGKFIADLIALAGEKFDPADGITLFDPIHTYKKTVLEPNTYTVEELLVPLFVNGECVYEEKSLDEIVTYCNEQKILPLGTNINVSIIRKNIMLIFLTSFMILRKS